MYQVKDIYQDPQMVSINKNILNAFMLTSPLTVSDLNELGLLTKTPSYYDLEKKWQPGEKDYYKIITGVLDDQAILVSDNIPTLEEQLASKANFFEAIQPELDTILNKAVPNMQSHIEQFYLAGKNAGFKEMEVASFFGESDKHALFTLQNYNFDLVKNTSDDMVRGMREVIWQGIAKGETNEVIAEQMLKMPLEPLITSNGRVISSVNRAEMITRTESMRSMNQGSLLSFQQYGVEMIDVPPTGTEGEWDCDCPDIVDGSPYPIKKVPYLPGHPHCTHTYAPSSEPIEGVMDPDTYINLVLQGETPVIELT